MEWQTSCIDWADRLKTGRSIIPPPIFADRAAEALAVFKELRIVDAPGSPTFGASCAPWVFDLVASIFGAYDASTGRRLITEWFILIPKKNSKSTIAAGIMMTALILNWRQSGEFTVIAPTIEVAGNAYSPARDMVKKDDELSDLMHVQDHTKTITHRESNATFKVVAADSNTVSGKKSIGTLIEELWLFGKQNNAESMLREALGGLASRPEGFVVYVTTQSDDPPAGVFKDKLQYARDVRDGKIIDPGFVPIIFEHPPELVATGDHLKLENLPMVNPNLGYSVDRQFLEREYRKADQAGGGTFLGFLAKHGNVEIGLNLRTDRWAGADFWQKNATKALSLEDLIERSEVICVGIDGGGLDDLLGFAVIGRENKGNIDVERRKWLVWTHAWAHPIVLERRKQEAERLKDFEKEGALTIVDEIGQDVTELSQYAAKIYESGKLDKIGVDPHGLGSLMDGMVAENVPIELIIGISQGWKLNGAIKTAERKLAGGSLIHGGQSMMSWSVGNARVVPVGNAVTITKQASGSAKIDPLMAMFNAVTLMSLNPESKGSLNDFFQSVVSL
ncbi:terminase large subunit [Undibacterium sp.]|uniref:terminase large subunit n=1 Tax=Undibacterium sp. TaxID=1914977 RepID=UPI00374FEC08